MSRDADLYGAKIEEIAGAEPVAVPPCPVCGQTLAVPRFAMSDRDLRVVLCTECGHGRLDPCPTREEIRELYPAHYYAGEDDRKFEPLVEGILRWVAARHAAFWARGLPRGGRVLDVGCGRGVLLGSFLDRGIEAHGLEIGPDAVRGIDPRVGVRFADRLEDASFPEAHFDQILLWHVLEHLPDPRGTLCECRRILRPGGRIVIALPNLASCQARWAGPAWFHLDLPRHLQHFPVHALERLLGECGFRRTARYDFSLRQNPFGWLQSALNRLDFLPRNGLYLLLQPQSGAALRWPRRLKLVLRLCYWLGMPLGLLASLVETAFRSGATVTVVAERLADSAVQTAGRRG
ncbi:MAG TPA: class I SAM-dependent methyltransferase [Thermoanaerobaculia bacterium]|nr:class I SAM-dependent methyltransferase [Thermoanaerobaculia bacterium]